MGDRNWITPVLLPTRLPQLPGVLVRVVCRILLRRSVILDRSSFVASHRLRCHLLGMCIAYLCVDVTVYPSSVASRFALDVSEFAHTQPLKSDVSESKNDSRSSYTNL